MFLLGSYLFLLVGNLSLAGIHDVPDFVAFAIHTTTHEIKLPIKLIATIAGRDIHSA